MPTPFPAEFRADVIAVARKGEDPLRQIANDFGESPGFAEGSFTSFLRRRDRVLTVADDHVGRPVAGLVLDGWDVADRAVQTAVI